jgi:hypothetical protein
MPPTGLPLLHEEDVDGVVASVFVDIRARMPFVPAWFKALAADPDVLVAAWLQARAIYDDPRSPAAADEIRGSAQVGIGFQPSSRVRESVAPFVAELPFMLLIVTSLQLSASGELPLRPAPGLDLPAAAPVPEPEFSDRGEHRLFPEICAIYETQHLPSIFRTLGKRRTRRKLDSDRALPGQLRRSDRGRPRQPGSRFARASDARSRLLRHGACPTDTRRVLPRAAPEPDLRGGGEP